MFSLVPYEGLLPGKTLPALVTVEVLLAEMDGVDVTLFQGLPIRAAVVAHRALVLLQARVDFLHMFC